MKTISNLILIILISVFSTALYAQGLSCSQPEVVIPGNYNFSAYNGQSSFSGSQAGWYSFTPSNSGYLSINSCGSSSDTDLWIWSGSCSNLDTIANNDDVIPGSPCSSLTNVPLLAGTTYYFEWVNTWDSNPFNWSFSFIPLPNNFDSEINYLTNRFTKIPISQASNGIALGGTIKNLSGNNLSNVVLKADIYEISNMDFPIASFSSSPININFGEMSTVSSGVWSPALTSSSAFVIKYSKSQTEVDQVQSNDSTEQNLIIDFNYMARDKDNYSTTLNFPTSGECSQGVSFSLTGSDQMTGVQYYVSSTSQAHSIEVFSIVNGSIDATPLYSSVNLTTNQTGWLTHIFSAPLAVPAGDYLISVKNFGTTSFPLGCDLNVFTASTNYFKEGNLAWVPIENYGNNYAFMIRPKFGLDPSYDITFDSNINPGGEYTSIHSRQSITGNELQFSAKGKNIGTLPIQDVRLIVTLKNSSGTIIYEDSSEFQNLNPGAIGTFSIPNFLVTSYDDYTIDYFFESPSDQVLLNNSGSTNFSRTKQKMSRSLENDGSFGIGANLLPGTYDNGMIGQTFTLINNDFLDTVEFVLNAGTPVNQPIRVEIYATNGGTPTGSPIAFTDTYFTTLADSLNGVILRLPISTGTLPMNAGTYFFGVIENEGSIELATSSMNFIPNRAFVRWNDNLGGAWTPIEQLNLLVSLEINPIFELCSPLQVVSSVTPETFGNDGAINLTVSGGVTPYSYLWENNTTNQDISNLIGGTYSFEIIDANGCTFVDSIIVSTTVSIGELSNFDWSIKPNPGNDIIHFVSNENGELRVYDINGKLMKTESISKEKDIVDVSHLDSGIYMLHFKGQVKRWIKH